MSARRGKIEERAKEKFVQDKEKEEALLKRLATVNERDTMEKYNIEITAYESFKDLINPKLKEVIINGTKVVVRQSIKAVPYNIYASAIRKDTDDVEHLKSVFIWEHIIYPKMPKEVFLNEVDPLDQDMIYEAIMGEFLRRRGLTS